MGGPGAESEGAHVEALELFLSDLQTFVFEIAQ